MTMTSSRTDKPPRGAGKRRHHAQRTEKHGDHPKDKRARRGRKIPKCDRVASPDHEVVIPGSSSHLEIKEEQTASADEGVFKQAEEVKQDISQDKKDTAEGQATSKYTNAKFSGPRNLEQLKKQHDELAEYIRTMKEKIAVKRALEEEEKKD